MNLKESIKWQQEHAKRPSGIIVASDKPMEINEVVLYDEWRVRITEALTAEEFMRRHLENQKRSDFASGVMPVQGARALLDKSREFIDPPEHCKYFYAAEVHK